MSLPAWWPTPWSGWPKTLLSRRWFLIGSSASIAASKLSLMSNALAKPAEVTGAVIPASSWLLQDISFGGRAKQSFPVRLDMDLSCQGFSDPQFNFAVNAMGGMLRWVAPEKHEIKVPPGQTLRVKVEPDLGLDADLSLIYKNARTGLRYHSIYHWDSGRLTRQFLPLDFVTP